MKIGKIELTQKKLIIIMAAAAIAAASGVYLVFYAPLARELRMRHLECKSIEMDVFNARNVIGSTTKVYSERAFIMEEDIASAIDGLTRYGKMKGINFVSMSPKEVKGEKGEQYKILPVEMEIESAYEELGIFLGSLDELEKGLAKVKSFNITPDKKDSSKFTTNLIIDFYLFGKKYAE